MRILFTFTFLYVSCALGIIVSDAAPNHNPEVFKRHQKQTRARFEENLKQLDAADEKFIEKQVSNLGSDEFLDREEGTKKLYELGPVLLRSKVFQKALNSDDAEVVRRARILKKRLTQEYAPLSPGDYLAALNRQAKNHETNLVLQNIMSEIEAELKKQPALKKHMKRYEALLQFVKFADKKSVMKYRREIQNLDSLIMRTTQRILLNILRPHGKRPITFTSSKEPFAFLQTAQFTGTTKAGLPVTVEFNGNGYSIVSKRGISTKELEDRAFVASGKKNRRMFRPPGLQAGVFANANSKRVYPMIKKSHFRNPVDQDGKSVIFVSSAPNAHTETFKFTSGYASTLADLLFKKDEPIRKSMNYAPYIHGEGSTRSLPFSLFDLGGYVTN